MRIAIFAIAWLLSITSTHAAWDAMGVGINATCAQFAQDYRKAPDEMETVYYSWAQGFMSGMNFVARAYRGQTRDLGSIPLPQQMQDLLTFCSGNPIEPYELGVLLLYNKLKVVPPKPQ